MHKQGSIAIIIGIFILLAFCAPNVKDEYVNAVGQKISFQDNKFISDLGNGSYTVSGDKINVRFADYAEIDYIKTGKYIFDLSKKFSNKAIKQ